MLGFLEFFENIEQELDEVFANNGTGTSGTSKEDQRRAKLLRQKHMGKKITVKTKMGGEIPATIKVTGKDYHIVKTDSGKQYKVDHQGNSLEENIEDRLLSKYGSEKDKEDVHKRKMDAVKRDTEHAKAQSELEKHKAEISNTQHDTHRNQHNRAVDAAKADHERKVDISRRDQDHERRVQGNQQHHDRMMQADKNWHNREMERMKNSHERKMKEELEYVDEANSFVGHKDAPEDRIKKLETRYGKLSDSEKQSVHRGLDHVVHNNRNPNRAFAKSAVIKKEEVEQSNEAFVAPSLSAANSSAEYARQPKREHLKLDVKHVGGVSDSKSIKKHLASKGVSADVGTSDGYKTAHLTNLSHDPAEFKRKLGVKEEVEQVNEISTAAKQNYINAAALDVARHGNMLGRAQVGKSKTSASISGKKIDKRLQGIATATSKLTKEENDKDIPFDPPYSKVKTDVPAKGTKGTHTAMSRARHLARIALQNVQKKKNVKEQDGKISIGEEADKGDSKHRVLVTLSDPNHTMASQRQEKIQKHVKLSAASKEDAIARAQAYYRKRGYKVHDAEHVGIVKEETQGEQ